MNFDEITIAEAIETAETVEESETVEETEEVEKTEKVEETEEVEGVEENEETDEAEEAEAPDGEEREPDANEIAYLKAELDALKKKLADSRAFYARLEGECAEFSSLYPDVPLASLPDTIWQSVRSGVPLAAAYALEARKAELAAKKAASVNSENRNMSSGALMSDSYNDFFSPSQVKAMSAAEVRANYTKIINSMSKWH